MSLFNSIDSRLKSAGPVLALSCGLAILALAPGYAASVNNNRPGGPSAAIEQSETANTQGTMKSKKGENRLGASSSQRQNEAMRNRLGSTSSDGQARQSDAMKKGEAKPSAATSAQGAHQQTQQMQQNQQQQSMRQQLNTLQSGQASTRAMGQNEMRSR